MNKNNEKNNKKQLSQYLFTSILLNLNKRTINQKLGTIYNKKIRNFYYSHLNCYKGTWEDLYPLDGSGYFTIDDCISEANWQDGKANGIIKYSKQSNIIYEGEWYQNIIEDEAVIEIDDNNKEYYKILLKQGIRFSNILNNKNNKRKNKYECYIINNKLYDVEVNHKKYQEGQIITFLNNKEYIFEGKWKHTANYLINGKGTIIEDGNKYIRETESFENEGVIESKNGEIFKGKWDDYFWPIIGEGVFVSNEITYKGIWNNEYIEGEVLSGKDCVYKGTWNKYGHLINGEGSLYNPDGNRFDGKWNNEIGKGIITFPNGNLIEAEWDYLRRITKGNGIYYDKLERKYLGVIENGEGRGKIISLTSLEYEGTWDVDGLPVSGEGTFVFEGVIFKGIWTDSIGKGVIFS